MPLRWLKNHIILYYNGENRIFIKKMIKRGIINKIKEEFFQKKAIIILGARQVGKTTLIPINIPIIHLRTYWSLKARLLLPIKNRDRRDRLISK